MAYQTFDELYTFFYVLLQVCSEQKVLDIAGGHGIVFDGPKDKDFIALGNRFWAEGKIVSSVCHGPAGLVSMTAPDGSPIVKGHKVLLSALNGLKIY